MQNKSAQPLLGSTVLSAVRRILQHTVWASVVEAFSGNGVSTAVKASVPT